MKSEKRKKYFVEKKEKESGEVYYVMPPKNSFLEYERYYPDGVFQKGETCSALIKIKSLDFTGILRKIRFYNLDGKFLRLKDGSEYLMIQKDDKRTEFTLFLSQLTEELKKKRLIYADDTSAILNLDERLRLMHQIALTGKKDRSLNVSDYIGGTEIWKEDLLPQAYEYHEKAGQTSGIIEGENCSMAVLSVRAYPKNKEGMQYINSRMANSRYTELAWYFVNGIEDKYVIENIQANYMGLEGTMVKLKTRDPDFYRLYQAVSENTQEKWDDTQRYSFAGMLVLLKADSGEELFGEIEEIKKDALKHQGRVICYEAGKGAVFQNLIMNRWDKGFTRLILTDDLEGMKSEFPMEEKTEVSVTDFLV